PTQFSPEAILQSVTEHVVCGYQPLSIADDKTFTNCLVVMRPGTKKSELPTRAKVRTHINNSFVDYLDALK
ncbi:hypothetical protein C8Q76DRAFT_581973, partial [Earliella scabrosa]